MARCESFYSEASRDSKDVYNRNPTEKSSGRYH